MNTALALHSKQGYTIASEVISRNDIQILKAALNTHLDRFAQAYLEPFSSSKPDASFDVRISKIAKNNHGYAQSLLNAILSDSQNDPVIGNVIQQKNIQEMLTKLLPDHNVISYTTRVRACIPEFQNFTSSWHQDVADEERADGGCNLIRVAVWIPLSDVDEDTGALECIPGHYPHTMMERQENGRYEMPESIISEANTKVMSCKQGDAVFIDRFLPHRSLPVREGVNRWSIVTWVKAEAK